MYETAHTKINVAKDIGYLDKTIANKLNQKKLSLDLSQMMLKDINKYVPRHTGTLRDEGYNITLGNKSSKGPWFKITYRDTKKVPYVMYQYYGEVWGPNYPKFELEEEFSKNDLVMRQAKFKHVGWNSPNKERKSKHPTGRKFRRSRRKFQIKRGKYRGAWVTITGYTRNRKARPYWIEEAENHKHEWDSMWTNMRLAVEVACREAIEGKK